MHGTMAKKASQPVTYTRMARFLRQAEINSGNGGTGATIVKQSHTPLMQLLFESAQWERGVKGARKPIDGEKFGSHELEAAQEIESAFFALSGALMFKPLSMEKIGHSRPPEWNDKLSAKVERYRRWADHWSIMAKLCDPTMQVVIASVIDQRPFRDIGADLGFHHKRIRAATVRGLRDYAARAGWVTQGMAVRWQRSAGLTFNRASDSE